MTTAIPTGHDERGRYVRHVDGRRWYPYDCRPEDVRITDFWALRNIARFGGRTRYPIPVLCHSLRVLGIVREKGGTREEQWAALVHDAHEVAPPGDVETPMKRMEPDEDPGDPCDEKGLAAHLSGLEQRAIIVYRTWLHTPIATPQIVRDADAQAFAEEWAYLEGEQVGPLYDGGGGMHEMRRDWSRFAALWNTLAPIPDVPAMSSWWEVSR